MMSHVHQVDCVDRSLRDILKVDKPFGRMVVVSGGDPHQILPVVCQGSRSQIVKSCIHSSPLWTQIQQLSLKTNMRVIPEEIEFAEFLLTLGNGTAATHSEVGEDMIQVSKDFLVTTIDELIEKVFPGIKDGYSDKFFVSCCAILTPINDSVDKINESIMEKFPGEGKSFLSANSIAEDDLIDAYPTDFLNSISLSGMPPHLIILKVGAPIMLLRNMRAGPGNGLRNGTHLIILKLGKNVLDVKIASGVNKGNVVLILRITIAPLDTDLTFTLRRRQFPIRPCFAMSTNKAQGQTLEFVGIYLPEHVFTHGQIYVAFSRVQRSTAVAVYVIAMRASPKTLCTRKFCNFRST